MEKSLGDGTELDVAMVGGQFPTQLIAIGVGFAVGILVSGTARTPFTLKRAARLRSS
jgi:hypothetical protein